MGRPLVELETRETPAPVCQRLRAKEYYLDGPNSEAMAHSEPETAYWCLLSMQAFGPDGDYCCPEACVGGRECFEAE